MCLSQNPARLMDIYAISVPEWRYFLPIRDLEIVQETHPRNTNLVVLFTTMQKRSKGLETMIEMCLKGTESCAKL
jgi:hypothetical protein